MNGEADEWQVVVDPASGGVVKQKLQQHLCFIDFSAGGKCLLGSSEMASRIHTGSVWLFQDLSLPIDSDNSLARHYCSSPVMCGAFVNEELVIVAEDTGSVVTYLLNETDKVNFVPSGFLTPHDSWITAMSVCPGGDEVITGGGDSRICVLSDKGTTIKYTYHPAHGAVVSCVAASPSDSSVFASSSMDRSALLWDTRLPKPAKALMEGGCCYTAVAWKDENTVAIGSESGMVHIHDIRTNESSQVIHLQKGAVRKLIFNKNLLASSSDSANVRLWDFKAEEIIFPESNHKNFISDLSWDSKGVLYTCGFDGNVFSCPLT